MAVKMKFKKAAAALLLAAFAGTVIPQNILAAAKIIQVPEEQYASIEQKFTPIDITKQANRAFADDVAGDGKGGWGDGGPTNDLRDFTLRGEQYLRGVLFNIIEPKDNDDKSCIVLRGQNDMSVPQSVEVDVNNTAAGIYFLHAGSWLSERVGQYIFVYADGTEESAEIVGGRDMSDWWGVSETDTVRTAWKGSAPDAGIASLGLFALPNPYPEKEIAKLRLQTYGDASYAMIVAITLTDKGPYLPKTKVTDKFNPDTSEWYPYEYPRNYEKVTGTAMDVSFLLDAPSGKHGFAYAEGEDIVFEDGTKERFWGVNIDGDMIYPEYKQAEYTAMILAQRGVNLVRLHMYDVPHKEHNIFGWTDLMGTTREIDKQQLDKFHYLIYQLKKRGIYAFLDVSAGRALMEDDNIKDFKNAWSARYYDDQLQKLQQETTEKFMGAINPYTGISTLEEPTILVVNMNNETTIFNDNFSSSYYRGIITEKYNTWLKDRYHTQEELRAAWKTGEADGLSDGENLYDANVKVYGANEISLISGQRRSDNQHFLADEMEKYSKKMIEHYRSIGGKQMISVGTVWGNYFMSYAKGTESSDVMDYHAYYLHPSGMYSIDKGLKVPGDPISWIEDSNTGLFGRFSATRIKGKPYTISEWNTCEPNPYIADTPLLMGAYSGMQGWHPMQYTMSSDCISVEYRNSDKPVVAKNVFTGPDSPQVFDLMPAAAIAFHSVTEADGGYYKAMDGDRFYDSASQNTSFPNNGYLIAKAGIADKSLDNKQTGLENITLAAEKYSRENKKPYVSLTNEMYMDRENKLFKLNTPKSQAAAGFFKDEQIVLEDINITTDNEYAAIALSSVTDKPIYESDRLLLSASARAKKTGLTMSNDGTEILDGGSAPTLVEPVSGKFLLKTDAEVDVWALSSQGERKTKIPVSKTEGGVYFELKGDEKANNYEIVKKGGKRERNPEIDLGVYRDTPIFTDVAESDREQVERVCLTNVMSPTGENVFSPNQPVTRADFVCALVAALGLSNSFGENFSDVDKNKVYANSILIARSCGIVFGKEENVFAPEEALSAAEAKAMLSRAGRSKYEFSGDGKVSRLDAARLMYQIITE